MYILKKTVEQSIYDDEPYPEVTITIGDEVSLSKILETFESFLRAAGFSFEGTLTIDKE